jgi:hypothetical protein
LSSGVDVGTPRSFVTIGHSLAALGVGIVLLERTQKGHDPLYVASTANERPAFAGLSSKRMKGLEPSTFCMASQSRRSRPFAPVR